MWSQLEKIGAVQPFGERQQRDKLLVARKRMQEALRLLDESSLSAAAASLDLALHQLNRELS